MTKMTNRLLRCLALAACLLLAAVAQAEMVKLPSRPDPPRLVNDLAGVLGDTQALEDTLEAFSNATSNQILVVTVTDLQDLEPWDYAVQLGRAWGVGGKKHNNGVVILIKPKNDTPGRVTIQVGYGLEGIFNDAKAGRILDNTIIPYFRGGDFSAGLRRGVFKIVYQACEKGNYLTFDGNYNVVSSGYTNAKVEKRAKVTGRQKHGWAALLRRSKEVPYLSLFDVTVFRIAPYLAKAPFLYAKIRHDPMFGQDESNFWYEHAMYPRLAAAGFTSAKTVLGVFHTRGAHPPLVFDRDGHRLGTVGWGSKSLPDLVRNPLYNLARLMDALREKGVYDKSLVVVVADHGVGIAPHTPPHHPSESAILWVKPEGASGPLAYCGTPTGYSRIAAFMRSAATASPSAADAEAALREEDRLFRYQDADDRYHDIVVGPDGGIVYTRDY